MNKKETIKFAGELKKFMDIKLEDFDKNSNSFKFKEGFPPDLLQDHIALKKSLDEAFPDMDENITIYSMQFTMKYLTNIKKLKFIIETTIKNNS